MTQSTPIGYDIIDGHTGRKVGHARTRAAASRTVDRRDNAYGAYRYRAQPVYVSPLLCAELAPVVPEAQRLETRAATPLRPQADQQFDMSALPLFGDQRHQIDLMDLITASA